MQRVAIVGAAEPDRNDPARANRFDPPVDVDSARRCAQHLGTALAQGGYGLIVYDARFIEGEVVTAYVAAGPTAAREGPPIIVRQPIGNRLVAFPEEATHPTLFERVADGSGRLAVSFYRSLANADGLALIGGGYATSVAGQVAIGAGIPILALMRSGGAAETVWRTIAPGVDLPDGNEHARMADLPEQGAGQRWAAVLESQRMRRRDEVSGGRRHGRGRRSGLRRFAVVGQADEARNDPTHPFRNSPSVDVHTAKASARALGHVLAKAGHGLIVYDGGFIEAEVVTAFVAANPKAAEMDMPILVWQPRDAPMVRFAEEFTHPALFHRNDELPWEVFFYRSIADADGVILMGGGNSTLTAGLVAIGARTPILALMRTGGAAETVWRTIEPGVDLPVASERAQMALLPGPESADRWVQLLEAQASRRLSVEDDQRMASRGRDVTSAHRLERIEPTLDTVDAPARQVPVLARHGDGDVHSHPQVSAPNADSGHQVSAGTSARGPRVFVSYARSDREWLDRISLMMTPLLRGGLLDWWDDSRIGPGKWLPQIEEAMQDARVALFLVSEHLLASDFVHRKELPDLLAAANHRGLKIVWVLLSDCLWKRTVFSEYQGMNAGRALQRLSVAEQNAVLVDVCEAVLNAVSDASPDKT